MLNISNKKQKLINELTKLIKNNNGLEYSPSIFIKNVTIKDNELHYCYTSIDTKIFNLEDLLYWNNSTLLQDINAIKKAIKNK
jgi:hypothetical protein